MRNLADIKRRLSSVKQTQRITGAMEIVSAAKMRKAAERLERSSAYFDALRSVMRMIASSDDPDVKEMLAPPATDKKLVIVMASDKGLCGSFNHDVLKTADAIVDENTTVMPIGRSACEHYSGGVADVDGTFGGDTALDHEFAKSVSDVILGRYFHSVKSIDIVYAQTVSGALWTPKAQGIFPLRSESDDAPVKNVEFEPSVCEVLEKLLPIYVSGTVFGAILHSAAAEHGARRAAMSASSKNADDMITALSAEYNGARQSAVTEQLIDIVGSAQAIGEI